MGTICHKRESFVIFIDGTVNHLVIVLVLPTAKIEGTQLSLCFSVS